MATKDYFINGADDETVVAVVKGVGFDYTVGYIDYSGRYGVWMHEAEDHDNEFEPDILNVYPTLKEALVAVAEQVERDLNAELANPLSGMTDKPVRRKR